MFLRYGRVWEPVVHLADSLGPADIWPEAKHLGWCTHSLSLTVPQAAGTRILPAAYCCVWILLDSLSSVWFFEVYGIHSYQILLLPPTSSDLPCSPWGLVFVSFEIPNTLPTNFFNQLYFIDLNSSFAETYREPSSTSRLPLEGLFLHIPTLWPVFFLPTPQLRHCPSD